MDSNATESSFTITESAARFMRRMVRLCGGRGGFRLVVSAAGCSGLSAQFDVEPTPRPGDRLVVFVAHGGLSMHVPEASFELLRGAIVDFDDRPTETGFSFTRPGADACGCATGANAEGVQLTAI